jgi:enoyl-CoA hydratase
MTRDLKDILVEKELPLGWITLNRPDVLNALSPNLVKELALALVGMDADPEVRVIVITGGEKVFAAGADIKRMADAGPFDPAHSERWKHMGQIKGVSKPLIAAVSGFALGGGLELAMSCDIVIASETARFGQPEINLGIIPGGGGTQRLTRTIGKYKAMELVLTGSIFSSKEAYEWGLINRVVPTELLLTEAKELGIRIAGQPIHAVALAKESILKSANSSLTEGLRAEAEAFQLLFSTADQKEGMKASLERLSPLLRTTDV